METVYPFTNNSKGKKSRVMHLLTDEDATCEDIKAGLLECPAMLFSTTTESLFEYVRPEGDKMTAKSLADRAKRCSTKLLQEAETLPEAAEKIAVAFIRSKLNPEVKYFMDLTEVSCMPRYFMKVEEWETSYPQVKSMFKQEHNQTSHRQTMG